MKDEYNDWDSRRELLTSMFNKFITECSKMKVYDAVSFSSGMTDCFAHAIAEAATLNAQNDGDSIIQSALK